MGPAASESNVTPDLLKEAGYRYVMDWPADDQPFWLQTRAGPILSVPYPAELNDSAAIIHRDAGGSGQRVDTSMHAAANVTTEVASFTWMVAHGTVQRQTGRHAGRILKGQKPSELPVQRVTKLELFINLKAASALGITFPPAILTSADRVIE